jgi:hypothetical protein
MSTPSSSSSSFSSSSSSSSGGTKSDKAPEGKDELKEFKGEVKGLDDGGDDEVFKLVSQEGEKIPVAKKIGMLSELVKTMAEGGAQVFAFLVCACACVCALASRSIFLFPLRRVVRGRLCRQGRKGDSVAKRQVGDSQQGGGLPQVPRRQSGQGD